MNYAAGGPDLEKYVTDEVKTPQEAIEGSLIIQMEQECME